LFDASPFPAEAVLVDVPLPVATPVPPPTTALPLAELVWDEDENEAELETESEDTDENGAVLVEIMEEESIVVGEPRNEEVAVDSIVERVVLLEMDEVETDERVVELDKRLELEITKKHVSIHVPLVES
jgi:hypothetical protein